MERPTRLRLTGLLVLALTTLPAAASDSDRPHLVGIDVSHHSGEIDWERVEEHDYAFVYVKATEGVDAPDPMFEQHWARLKELGIPRGAYHFYVTEDDPKAQAEFFLSRLQLEAGDLPPVVDIELIGAGTHGELAPRLRTFLEIVEERTGVRPVIYTSAGFWNTHLEPTFGDYPLWVAEYDVAEPRVPEGWSRWLLWQYVDDAEVPGIEKAVDESRLHPEADLASLLVPAPATTSE